MSFDGDRIENGREYELLISYNSEPIRMVSSYQTLVTRFFRGLCLLLAVNMKG